MAYLRNPVEIEGLYNNNDRVPTVEDIYYLKHEAQHYYYNQSNGYINMSYQYAVPPPIKMKGEPEITMLKHELSDILLNKANISSCSSNSSNNSLDVNVTTAHHTNHKVKPEQILSRARDVNVNGSVASDDKLLTDQYGPDRLPVAVRTLDEVPEDKREGFKQRPLRKEYKCTYCSMFFATINLRKQHESTGHTGAKLHKCNHCDMCFTTQYRKKVHEIRHGNDCPYICPICGDSFKSFYKRQVHERAHSGQRPYRCLYCGEKFSSQYRKNMHEVGHISETPFECRYCDETFKTQYRCKQHELGHSRDKPYRCQFCQESFKSAYKRYIHILSHSGLANPYQCPKCLPSDKSASFRTPYKLRAHLVAIHRLKSTDMRELVHLTSQHDALVLASTSQHAATGQFGNEVGGNTERERVNCSPGLSYLKKLPDDEVVTCFSCNAMFGNKLHLISHIRTMHTFTFL